MMKIIKKKYREWDQNMKRKLRYATYPGGFLKRYMQTIPDSLTFVVFNGKQIMGWMFIANLEVGNHVNIFINKRFRNKGLATQFIHQAVAIHPQIILAEWEPTTKKLFGKLRRQYPGKIKVIDWWKNTKKYKKILEEYCLNNKKK